MAFNQALAQRVQNILDQVQPPSLSSKKMFGGIGFLVNGNMACGVHGDGLIVRVHPDRYQADMQRPFTRVFDLTGKTMKGWLVVDLQGLFDDHILKSWVEEGVAFALTLPPK